MPVVKSLEDQDLPSTAPITPRPCEGWSQSGRFQVAKLDVGGSEDTLPLRVEQSLPNSAFPTHSIERSSDLEEPVFQTRVMVIPSLLTEIWSFFECTL